MNHMLTRRPLHLLVVCHGNICRSPLASAVLAHNLGGSVVVRSRGFYREVNRKASKKVREYAEQLLGYSLDEHRSHLLTQEDVDWADKILYMDAGNKKRLQSYEGAIDKARCLGNYVGLKRIPDPNFTTRGAKLDMLLSLVVKASENFASRLGTDVAVRKPVAALE